MNYFKWTAETHNGAPKRAQAHQTNQMNIDRRKKLEKKKQLIIFNKKFRDRGNRRLYDTGAASNGLRFAH